MIPPGRDTNPSQISSQQMLVLYLLSLNVGKPSLLWRKRRSHKESNLTRVAHQTWVFASEKQTFYFLHHPFDEVMNEVMKWLEFLLCYYSADHREKKQEEWFVARGVSKAPQSFIFLIWIFKFHLPSVVVNQLFSSTDWCFHHQGISWHFCWVSSKNLSLTML